MENDLKNLARIVMALQSLKMPGSIYEKAADLLENMKEDSPAFDCQDIRDGEQGEGDGPIKNLGEDFAFEMEAAQAAYDSWCSFYETPCLSWEHLSKAAKGQWLRIVVAGSMPLINDTFTDMQHRLACVLCHATGGRMSKTNYAIKTMYAEIDDFIERERDEACEEGRQDVMDSDVKKLDALLYDIVNTAVLVDTKQNRESGLAGLFAAIDRAKPFAKRPADAEKSDA